MQTTRLQGQCDPTRLPRLPSHSVLGSGLNPFPHPWGDSRDDLPGCTTRPSSALPRRTPWAEPPHFRGCGVPLPGGENDLTAPVPPNSSMGYRRWTPGIDAQAARHSAGGCSYTPPLPESDGGTRHPGPPLGVCAAPRESPREATRQTETSCWEGRSLEAKSGREQILEASSVSGKRRLPGAAWWPL